jgi:hypothetical protein
LSDLKHWFINYPGNENLDFFLQRINRLYVHCASIIDLKTNEEIMTPLLTFLIDKYRFPQLRCLRFVDLRNISSAWCNIDQWISFILSHIMEHQLTCIRFDFVDKEQEPMNLQRGDESIAIVESAYIIDVHRLVCKGLVSLWIERRQK